MLFPHCCLTCNAALTSQEQQVCVTCQANLPTTDLHQYQPNPLHYKLSGKAEIMHAMAYLQFSKGGKVQRLLHSLKYHHNPELGRLLGLWYGHYLRGQGCQFDFDLITAVPLHPSKLRKRGYNQSAVFGQGLGEALQIPFEELLIRQRHTESQTRKTQAERWTNVAEVFAPARTPLSVKHLLLVDDVITTGATLSACIQALQAAGVMRLSIATIATAG
jgi:ComF family protein